MGTGIHNSSFTPKGFKDPSISKHHTEEWGLGKNHFVARSRTPECKSPVESKGVIMWHQPKQSAKKKANQQELPCICIVWVWSKLAENLSSYPRSQHPGFPSFFQNGWHNPGGHVPLKKIALHTCINVQNAKNSKPRHNSSQQTSAKHCNLKSQQQEGEPEWCCHQEHAPNTNRGTHPNSRAWLMTTHCWGFQKQPSAALPWSFSVSIPRT